MQPVQDLTVEDRVSRTQYQYSLEDPDRRSSIGWTDRLLDDAAARAGAARRRERPAERRAPRLVVIDRDTASRFGITPQIDRRYAVRAFGQRQVSTIFTQLNQYHVVLEVQPQFQQNPLALNDIYVPIDHQGRRCAFDSRWRTIDQGGAADDQPPGAVSRR